MAAELALLLALAMATLAPGPARALDIEFSGRPVKLDILALYDGRRERQPHLTRIHKLAEMPLNHMGFRVVYQDVNARLPAPEALGRYLGVLTWFAEPLARPEAVLGWIDQALARGLKYVALGEIAPRETDAMLPLVNRVLARIGLEHGGTYVDLSWRARVVDRDPDMLGFERPIDKVLPGFPVLSVRGDDADAHLVLEGPLGGGRVRSAVVATSSGGGYASGNFAVYYEPNTDRMRWTLNPFAFFTRAFGDERRPVPDVTTLAGRRMYFSHIDGDGWNNVSEIEGHRDLQRFSAEVIEREAIVPFPDLPVTVGVIAGDVDPSLGGNPTAAAIARRLYALPQVEVATHTYSHPFNWQFFERYDRVEEVRRIDQHATPALSLRERYARQVLKTAGRPMPADQTDKYIAGSDDLPRTYLRYPFDLERETAGALEVSEGLAPTGKRAAIYLWSGDTTPFPAAIKAVRQAGARNINGGDSRLDAEYPSVAYVPPISRPAGAERQIYAANSNENTYTNDWTGPYHGFFMLEHTLANTESPRRLKPFNLYYHMYSGEKSGALAAVKHILGKARQDRVIPVRASQYAAIADSFFGVEIVQVDLFSWAVSRRGALSTVRFDEADQLAVDLARSIGILGSSRHGTALYVALDPGIERAVVTLRGRTAEQAARRETAARGAASLIDSRWMVRDLVAEECGFRFTAEGFGTGDMSWQTGAGRGFRVTTRRGAAILSEETRWADEQGNFNVRIGPSAIEPLEIRFTCHD
ncbi:MAG: hypothetical protein SFW09_12445 [Hyphomicrobiaceae bacterium]|nr:hypothetical protein [Hyphomicrobiaceae bacterium]